MSMLAEQLENLIREAIVEEVESADLGDSVKKEVESFLDDYDWECLIREEMPDIEQMVDKAADSFLDNYDFNDVIHDTVKDYDWWEEIEGKVKDDLEEMVEERVNSVVESPEFSERLKEIAKEAIKEMLAESWQRFVRKVTQPFRDCVTVLKTAWQRLKSR